MTVSCYRHPHDSIFLEHKAQIYNSFLQETFTLFIRSILNTSSSDTRTQGWNLSVLWQTFYHEFFLFWSWNKVSDDKPANVMEWVTQFSEWRQTEITERLFYLTLHLLIFAIFLVNKIIWRYYCVVEFIQFCVVPELTVVSDANINQYNLMLWLTHIALLDMLPVTRCCKK